MNFKKPVKGKMSKQTQSLFRSQQGLYAANSCSHGFVIDDYSRLVT